ncbi:MAG: hypothetical protein H9Q65_03540 [Spiroplasma ixodetis]|uniref:hypothetical protein n=1 Tax=Spiroplasma endosymbiont of Lariophagus distinguendus TaxID=2935082 RepID=UPI001E15B3C7|nr:hypothetical protein [Spiroplasma endosymbiont of Lariophagus distinguendus]MBP1525647.1 hypothetical protein [Spiroplasma ixodetis]MBP1526606.1 hypothetical protein [Spiroplasma ixodetis]MBP1528309.1 hypothetical protein [Spiroplasma ixodetis]
MCSCASIDSSSRVDAINNAIEKEIKDFLLNKNDINYVFKNGNLYQQMKNEVKTAIIDLRYNKYTLNKSYINRSENKIKQIQRIINKYYKLDKKNIIEIDNEEVTNNIILIENKEIDNE